MCTNDSNCNLFCVRFYHILKQNKNFNIVLSLVYYLMDLRIYSTAVERTDGAMLLLVGTRLMHSLKGNHDLEDALYFRDKHCWSSWKCYIIISMLINIIYNHLKNKYRYL
jgi:hypothetical protein